jgi:hypothetical protein
MADTLPPPVLERLTYTEDQVADACIAAEIPDSKCESLLIALRALIGGEG